MRACIVSAIGKAVLYSGLCMNVAEEMCKVMGEPGEVLLRLGESCGECLHVLRCDEFCSI
jgi:hypothetical protein